MNVLKHIVLVAALALLAAGCGKKVEISLASNEITVPSEGGTAEVALYSNGDWSVTSNSDWITVSPMSGSGDEVLTLSAAANDGTESRLGEITVATKDRMATLTVRQGVPYITLTPGEIECMVDGGSFEVALSSNCAWEVLSAPNWISCSVMSGENDATLVVTVDYLNDDVLIREADVQIGNATVSALLHVVQRAPEEITIVVNPTLIEVEGGGGVQSVSVTCPVGWTAQTGSDWIALDAASGEGDATITVTVAANEDYVPRSGLVVFTTSERGSAYLTVNQEASGVAVVELQPDTVYISPEGDLSTITLTSNTSWTLFTESWVSLFQTEGTGNAQIGLYVDKNPSAVDRMANVYAKSNNQVLDQVVVFQPGRVPYLETDVAQIAAANEGGVYTINISSNQAWMVNKGSDWMHYEPENGYGNGQLVIGVDANMSSHPRSAELHLNGLEDGSVVMITIKQGY